MIKHLISLSLFAIIANFAIAQESPISWEINESRADDGAYIINISAVIAHDWYVYGMNMDEGGPLPLFISFEDTDSLVSAFKCEEIVIAKKMYDEVFEMDVMSYKNRIHIKCRYVPYAEVTQLNLTIDGQACNKSNGSCMQVYESIPITIK